MSPFRIKLRQARLVKAVRSAAKRVGAQYLRERPALPQGPTHYSTSPIGEAGSGEWRSGFGREGLYKALSGEGNLQFARVMTVIKALGLRLCAQSVGT